MNNRTRLYTSGYRAVYGGGIDGRGLACYVPVRLLRPSSLRDRLPSPLVLAAVVVVLAAVIP